MSKLRRALGKQIQHLRRRSGLTQEGLAEKMGLSLKHLGEIERGRANPTVSTLERIAKALDVPFAELFDCDHEELSPKQIKAELNLMIKR